MHKHELTEPPFQWSRHRQLFLNCHHGVLTPRPLNLNVETSLWAVECENTNPPNDCLNDQCTCSCSQTVITLYFDVIRYLYSHCAAFSSSIQQDKISSKTDFVENRSGHYDSLTLYDHWSLHISLLSGFGGE